MTLDVSREDYMQTPGRLAVLEAGPLTFWIGTADGIRGGFEVRVFGVPIGWRFGG